MKFGQYSDLIISAFVLAAVAGCGQVKERADKQIVAQENGSNASATPAAGSHMSEETIKKLAAFYDLYADKDGISQAGMTNVFEKYKDQFGKVLSGTALAPKDLVDMLFSFDRNHNGKLTVKEVESGMSERIPTLGWMDADEELSAEELAPILARQYPETSVEAREGLAKVLLSFDRPYADGDGNGKLSRKELSMAGVLMGALHDMDFTAGVPCPDDADEETRLTFEILHNKLNMQMYGRYEWLNWHSLSKADLHLEWLQLSLKFYLVDKLTQSFHDDGKVAFADVREAVMRAGIPLIDRTDKLKKFYDSVFQGGDGDGKLNTIELFNLLSDLEFAVQVRRRQELTTDKLVGKSYFFNVLMTVFPRTGNNLFLTGSRDNNLKGKHIRKEYWDKLMTFDSLEQGGNANSSLDPGELAVAFGHAQLLERVFALYDKNHDGLLSRQEVEPLFKRAGIEDKEAVRIFFADIGLDGNSSHFGMGFKLFFSGKKNLEALSPYEFYLRMEEVLPKVFEKKH